MQVVVDGLETRVDVDDHVVDEILLPALATVAPQDGQRRRFVFLVAPPGTGKSTLAAVVRGRARQLDLDVVGIDGFHHSAAYLRSHRRADGVLLDDVKGAPESFDVERLRDTLEQAATRDLEWPVYDRATHDVATVGSRVTAGLVLLEGNWLLLDEPVWTGLSEHSVYTVFIDAEPALLRERLIRRKQRGGMDGVDAVRFYERSDRANVERVLQHSDRTKVDLLLELRADGTIRRKD